MAALHGFVDLFDDDTGNFEEQELIEQDDELATDKDDLEEMVMVTVREYQELPPMNIINITGIVSNDDSIGTIPWNPVKRSLAKSMQPPSRPTLCDQGQHTLPQELVYRSQQTAPGYFIHNPNQTLANSTADLSVQTESYN